MRVRNPKTGTVIGTTEEAGRRLLAAGWERADAVSASSAPADGAPKTRRRRSAQQ